MDDHTSASAPDRIPPTGRLTVTEGFDQDLWTRRCSSGLYSKLDESPQLNSSHSILDHYGHRDHPRNSAPNSMNELVDEAAIDDATARIAPHVMRTPLFRSAGLSDDVGVDIFVKVELFQPTGSFKVRGVFNKALTLSDDEKERGLIAFSAGNHAMGVAHVGAGLSVPVTVCMPARAVRFKVDAVEALGANLELVDGDLVAHAMRRQEQLNATLIHPFDDPAVIAGTATIGRELLADLPDVYIVIVPVGGGGLISGVAAA